MTSSLADRRILIVEDDYFLATDLQRMLVKEGVNVFGPVGTLDAALAVVATQALDAALLGVNLGEDSAFPIVDALRSRAVPCMFITGFDTWCIPEAYRDVPRVMKPSSTNALLTTIDGLVVQEQV